METISLISTKSVDYVENKITKTFYKIEGGPYKFISSALDKLQLKFKGHLGDPIEIDIVVDKFRETGSIRTKPKTKPIPKKLNQITIISTIYDEWDISEKIPNSKIFLDIQGMVRTNLGKQKKKLIKNIDIFKNIFCIKGNKEEIKFLPQEIIRQQKKFRTLIVTNNSKSISLYHKNKYYTFKFNSVKTVDTIGAGDTFLGFVVGNFVLNGGNIKKATKLAIIETSNFLQKKGEQ